MNRKVLIYAAIHGALAILFCAGTDPFGILIVGLAMPAAAAAAVSCLAGLFDFWPEKRWGQLPLLLLATLFLVQSIANWQLYGYIGLEWLGPYFPVFAIQYGSCLLTLMLLRRSVDKA